METKNKEIVNFFFELGMLRKINRAHNQTLLDSDLSDNIASHSFRVAAIGWFLAKIEKVDYYKVITMCLFHDTEEARSGDHNWVHKKYVKVYDDEITKDQLSPLPYSQDLFNLKEEYSKRESKESKVAKDADLLDQILLLKEYAWRGNKEAEEWLKEGVGDLYQNEQVKRLHFDSTKKLAEEIYRQKPSEWWNNLWTPKNR